MEIHLHSPYIFMAWLGIGYVFMAWYLVKDRDNFNLTLPLHRHRHRHRINLKWILRKQNVMVQNGLNWLIRGCNSRIL